MKQDLELRISTVVRRFAASKACMVEVNARSLFLRSTGWAWQALGHQAYVGDIKPVYRSKILSALRTLTLVPHHSRANRLLNLPLAELRMQDVLDVFVELEVLLAEDRKLAPSSRAIMSSYARTLLSDYLKFAEFRGAQRLTILFRTKLPQPKVGRALISDLPVSDGVGGVNPPSGAVSHTSLDSLRKQTVDILEKPLTLILAACQSVIEKRRAFESRKLQLLETQPDPVAIAHLVDWHAIGERKKILNSMREWAHSVPVELLAHAYLHLIYFWLPCLGVASPRQTLRRQEVDEYLRTATGIDVEGDFLAFPATIRSQEVTACLLAIQEATRWNVSSVLELTESSIFERDSILELRSIKTKTNQLTPPAILGKEDAVALSAVTFLRERLQALKSMRWVGEQEVRLWINPGRGIDPFAAWPRQAKNFQVRHRLPKFSLEQIRTQRLTADAASRGEKAAQAAAGHASLSTTSIYIQQLLTSRLSSAINLEFERRIEAEIREQNDHGQSYLYAVGDGSSCISPQHPPFAEYLESGVCDAKRCHWGDGCPNNKIVINRMRIEELLRTEYYYRNNWKRLYERSPSGFTANELPTMIFVLTLHGVLRRGPYAHEVRLVREMLEGIDDEG